MKLSTKKKETIFYIGVLVFYILIFTLAGENGYYEYPDSWQYTGLSGGQGIMPVYPLFIHFHRRILGDGLYLYGVVFSQTVLAVFCLMVYIIWIRKRFAPGYLVSGLIMVVSLVPFAVDFPPVLVNHAILTEALAYPLFYLFAISFVETMIRKKYRWVCLNAVMSIMLALVRTQMQLCLAFTALALLYMVWRKSAGKKGIKKVGYVFAALIACVCIVLAGELLILRINGILQVKMNFYQEQVAEKTIWVVEESGQDELVAANGVSVKAAQDEKGSAVNGQKENVKTVSVDVSNVTGQLNSVLIDRTFYEMDEEDSELFKDPEAKALFLEYFVQADQAKARYIYAQSGLWKWKDIMNGTAAGTACMYNGRLAYLERNPDSAILDPVYWMQLNRQIAFTLLKAHWPRMLYHTLCMLPQGFICTVFFQKEAIYGLCHLYTLLVYLTAIVLTVWGFLKKDFPEERKEFMLGVLTLNIGMVVVISVIFFGMQRYLIYGFGVFYAAYLLMMEQLYKTCGRTLWKKIKSRF